MIVGSLGLEHSWAKGSGSARANGKIGCIIGLSLGHVFSTQELAI